MKKFKAVWIYVWFFPLMPIIWSVLVILALLFSFLIFLTTFDWDFKDLLKQFNVGLNPIPRFLKDEKYLRENIIESFNAKN